MKIEVKYFTSLREITGKKVDVVQSENSLTVDRLLTKLAEKYGKDFKEYVYNKEGKVRLFLSILINGKNINKLQGFNSQLKESDVVAILPPVGGG